MAILLRRPSIVQIVPDVPGLTVLVNRAANASEWSWATLSSRCFPISSTPFCPSLQLTIRYPTMLKDGGWPYMQHWFHHQTHWFHGNWWGIIGIPSGNLFANWPITMSHRWIIEVKWAMLHGYHLWSWHSIFIKGRDLTDKQKCGVIMCYSYQTWDVTFIIGKNN